jgi:hypothetical protein
MILRFKKRLTEQNGVEYVFIKKDINDIFKLLLTIETFYLPVISKLGKLENYTTKIILGEVEVILILTIIYK